MENSSGQTRKLDCTTTSSALTLYNTTSEFAYSKLERAGGKTRLCETFILPALYNDTSEFADGKLERADEKIRLYNTFILPALYLALFCRKNIHSCAIMATVIAY